MTSWWQGASAGYFDFTRRDVAEWWSARVESIRTDFGFDSFKFDAGEVNWLSTDFHLDSSALPTSQQPNGYSTAFVRAMERFGAAQPRIVEVRVGWNTQVYKIILKFIKLIDLIVTYIK